MIAIIAVNNLGFIGFDGKLPWKCSADLAHFKAITVGKRLLVGYNTFQKLPEVVQKRVAFVTGRGNQYFGLIHGLICIGGKKTYEKYAHAFTELHISRINDNTIGDCTAPDFSGLNPKCKIFMYEFEVDKPVIEIIGVSIQDTLNSISGKI